MSPLVHLVADYGPGDVAFAEVFQRLALVLPGAVVHPTPVRPFDTVAAGFVVAQLALTDGPDDRVILHNVAPRHDESAPRSDNEGERFCVGRTHAGVLIFGPNAGWSWSFCADELQWLRYLEVPTGGSQFRSRDFLPAAAARLAAGDVDAVGGRVLIEHDVPAVPPRAIAYVDGYGNLKTTIDQAPAAVGAQVEVRIGEVAATATVSDGTFSVGEGELSLAPGSSGWATRAGGRRGFFELLLRGGSAAERFADPVPGTTIELQPA